MRPRGHTACRRGTGLNKEKKEVHPDRRAPARPAAMAPGIALLCALFSSCGGGGGGSVTSGGSSSTPAPAPAPAPAPPASSPTACVPIVGPMKIVLFGDYTEGNPALTSDLQSRMDTEFGASQVR